MATIKPLYFGGGEWTAAQDRKFISSLISTDANGNNLVGVIQGFNLEYNTTQEIMNNNCMAVKALETGLTITIDPGYCLISDYTTANPNNTSLYLAGIEDTAVSFTLNGPASGTRTDLIYAQIDDISYKILSASKSGNTVTLTTDVNHNFLVGDTLFVSGIEEVFNGSYVAKVGTTGKTIIYDTNTSETIDKQYYYASVTDLDTQDSVAGTSSDFYIVNRSFLLDSNSATGVVTITTNTAHGLLVGDNVKIAGLNSFFDGEYVIQSVPTTTTFTYKKSGTRNFPQYASNSLLKSNFAVVRVPFSIRQAINTTQLPKGNVIPLAEVDLTSYKINTIRDRRKFIPFGNGLFHYSSTAGGSTNANRPDHAKGRLAWDISTNKIYMSNGTEWLEIYTEVNHTNHSYSVRYYNAPNTGNPFNDLAKPVSIAYSNFATITGNAYANVAPLNIDPPATKTITSVTINIDGSATFTTSTSHGLSAFDEVVISGCFPATGILNGVWIVDTTSGNTFTVTQDAYGVILDVTGPVTVSSGTATLLTRMSTSFTSTTNCYALVQLSINVTNMSGTERVYADIKLTGDTLYSPMISSNSLLINTGNSNSMNAINGTSTSQSDIVYGEKSNNATTTASYVASKLIMFNAGTTEAEIYVACNQPSDSFTINYATLRIIPIYNQT